MFQTEQYCKQRGLAQTGSDCVRLSNKGQHQQQTKKTNQSNATFRRAELLQTMAGFSSEKDCSHNEILRHDDDKMIKTC